MEQSYLGIRVFVVLEDGGGGVKRNRAFAWYAGGTMAAAGGAGIRAHCATTGCDSVAHDARSGSDRSSESSVVRSRRGVDCSRSIFLYLGDRSRLFYDSRSVGLHDSLRADGAFMVHENCEADEQRDKGAGIQPITDRNQFAE